jgi:hypothetical protein
VISRGLRREMKSGGKHSGKILGNLEIKIAILRFKSRGILRLNLKSHLED